MSTAGLHTGDGEESKDQELAAFTDTLLEGNLSDDRPPLAGTVETLAQALAPQPPPTSLHRRLKRLIVAEWPRPRPSLGQRLLKSFGKPRQRWVFAAVAALIVVMLAIVLLIPADTAEVTTGTAVGDAGTIVLIVALLLAGILAIAWFASRRK